MSRVASKVFAYKFEFLFTHISLNFDISAVLESKIHIWSVAVKRIPLYFWRKKKIKIQTATRDWSTAVSPARRPGHRLQHGAI